MELFCASDKAHTNDLHPDAHPRCLAQVTSALPSARKPTTQTGGTRDAWVWPFSSKSIWNMPIGANAVYKPTGFRPANSYIGFDLEYFVRVGQSDPVVPVLQPSSWQTRWPGKGSVLANWQMPSGLVIPDATPGHTPNNCYNFLMPNGRTLRQLEPATRVVKGAHIVGWPANDQDLHGEGILGAHW